MVLQILVGLLLLLALYMWAQQIWVVWNIVTKDARRTLATPQNRAPKGITLEEREDKGAYEIRRVIEDGIERISYTPKQKTHATPILFVHGMWHGAWCWDLWQALFAQWGWESTAISLPGHAASPVQRPIRLCTLDYYLSFVRDEIDRLPTKPIVFGHSMGGAITQWYLRYVTSDLPAVVLVAPWVAQSALADAFFLFWKLDPLGCALMFLDWSATPLVRSPHSAAKALISPKAAYTPEQLFAKLTPESALVTYQHNPPMWKPAENIKAPMLILAGEKDAVVTVAGLQKSAAHYKADFVLVKEAGHNIMMDVGYQHTAQGVAAWLKQKNL